MAATPLYHWTPEWNVSEHAIQRWIERIGNTSNVVNARRLIEIAVNTSVLVPNRLASKLWVNRVFESVSAKRRLGMRYRLTGNAVLVMSGQTIITILIPSDEDLATMCVWRLTGVWLGHDEDDGQN